MEETNRKAFKIAHNFYKSIYNEVKSSDDIYEPKDVRELKSYYYGRNNKFTDFDHSRFYFSTRTSHLLKHLKKGDKVLDAGCGLGSEAILCALLGGRVEGIDLAGRLETAKQRKLYYEKKYKKTLNLSFQLKNVLKHSGKYDIIWTNEAISHIAPISEFLKMCYDNLESGGKLIISDANDLNPLMFKSNRAAQKSSGGIYHKRKDPLSGEIFLYAMERCFTIPSIKSLLKRKFIVNSIHPFGYFPPFVFNRFKKISKFLEKILSHIPILRLLSGAYVIVCTKV